MLTLIERININQCSGTKNDTDEEVEKKKK
jgi:hypothetical protein